MAGKQKKPVQTVTKPFITGGIADENTIRNALKFFGTILLVTVMTFIVCMMTHFDQAVLRAIANLAVAALVLFIMFSKGTDKGAEAVTRGEILYQRREKGAEMTEAERRLSYHPLKGYLNGLLGTLPLLIPAVVLALIAKRQMTSIGALPSWMGTMTRRSEIGDALVTYTQPEPMSFEEYLRVFVRACVMPYINMAGSENKNLLLTVERFSPILLLLPCAAFGTGYTQGRKIRSRVHTSIAESNRIRKRRENKARKARRNAGQSRGPEQLN